MSSKYLQAFTQESPDFQKQIGCMTGIFQMFDRHRLLGGRRLGGNKRIPAGRPSMKNGSLEAEQKGLPPQIILDKNLSKSSHENQRMSMESSRTSFSSSSCSSSFSSFECNKSGHQEPPPSYRKNVIPEKSSIETTNCEGSKTDNKHTLTLPEPCSELSNESVEPVPKPMDIRDMVKDSIYKDSHSLSVRTPNKPELKTRTLKHIDSPRPTPLPKHVDGSCRDGTKTLQRVPVDLNESLQVLVKLKEAPWHFSESTELPRTSYAVKDVPIYQASNGTPRFSYDGREASRASLDSRENSRPVTKLRELPRLSLDSRSSTFESSCNPVTKVLDTTSIKQRVAPFLKHQQESMSHNRLPGVVAKLMGLEDMPNSTPGFEESAEMQAINRERAIGVNNRQEHSIYLLHSSKTSQTSKEELCSPKASPKLPATMMPKNNQERLMKPISASRIPVETAPWRQHDKLRSNSRAGCWYREGNSKQENESVYSQIEKRLKELEFNQSNKDLRALKQILDTMQAKGLLESKRSDEKHFKASTQKRSSRCALIEAEESSSSEQDPSSLKQVSSVGKFQSPIVIMKPAKSMKKQNTLISSDIPLDDISHLPKLKINYSSDGRKSSFNIRTEKEQTPRLNGKDSADKKLNGKGEESNNSRKYSTKPLLNSVQTQHTHSNNMVKSASSISPRLHLKKLDAERKTCSPHSPGSNKINKQSSDSISPRNKLQRRLTQAHQSKEQINEACSIGHQDDEISLRSDSGTSLASHAESENISICHSAEWNNTVSQFGIQSPSAKAASKAASNTKQTEELSRGVNKNDSTIEPTTITPEQPSPISVLDASFFQDDLPLSLVKKLSDQFNDKDCQPLQDNSSHRQIGEKNSSTSKINHKKLEKIEDLVQKLKELNPINDESDATDHIASLCETKNPDHRYISEILLASGLLMKDLSCGPTGSIPIQLHPSGFPINPDLFLVLEQTKRGWQHKLETLGESKPKPDTQKLHRKLLFDSVNATLVKKLDLKNSVPCPDSLKKPVGKFPRGQQLIKELCLEIDQLQADCLNSESFCEASCRTGEEVMQQSEWLEDLRNELPGVVLEVERLIFKDMIVEILKDEIASRVQVKPCRQRRHM